MPSSGVWVRQIAIAVFTAALLAAVVVLGQIPLGKAGGDAILRLALRATHGKAEVCRDRTAKELEAMPQHMRLARQCDEVAPPYRLEVKLDDATVLDELIAPGGMRGDRPLIVDRQVPVPRGRVRLDVRFAPKTDVRLDEALARAGLELPSYALSEEVDFAADRITLVMLDDASGRLEIYEPR